MCRSIHRAGGLAWLRLFDLITQLIFPQCCRVFNPTSSDQVARFVAEHMLFLCLPGKPLCPIRSRSRPIIGIGPVAPLAQSIEVAMGVRLADHEVFAGLERYGERDPFAMLISVDIDVRPFEITGLAFPHAGIGHDQHIFPQAGAIPGDAGILRLFGSAPINR